RLLLPVSRDRAATPDRRLLLRRKRFRRQLRAAAARREAAARRSRPAGRRIPAGALRQAVGLGLSRPLRRHAVAHGSLRREVFLAAAGGDRPAWHHESAGDWRTDARGGGFPGAAPADER